MFETIRIYLQRRRLRQRYGVTEMTLWRWERDPLLEFPRPLIIKGKKFYDQAELEAWEAQRRAPSLRIVNTPTDECAADLLTERLPDALSARRQPSDCGKPGRRRPPRQLGPPNRHSPRLGREKT
jgi:predicted DNA-binding transcriptional regulator AlpA